MVRQRSWRNVVAQIVVNIPFVTVSEKLPSFEIFFHFNDCYQQAVPVKKHSILFAHLICSIIIYVRLERGVAYYLYRITNVIRDLHIII